MLFVPWSRSCTKGDAQIVINNYCQRQSRNLADTMCDIWKELERHFGNMLPSLTFCKNDFRWQPNLDKKTVKSFKHFLQKISAGSQKKMCSHSRIFWQDIDWANAMQSWNVASAGTTAIPWHFTIEKPDTTWTEHSEELKNGLHFGLLQPFQWWSLV